MFVCLGWKVSWLDEGIEGFLEPNPLIDGLSWVGQRLLKGGVCGWRLPSAVCLIDPRSAVVRASVHPYTIYCSLWVCVCVCLRGKLFVCSLSVCQDDFTTVIWLTSSSPCFSPTSLFPAVEIFRELKQLDSRTPLCRQTPTPPSLFSTDCTCFHFHDSWFFVVQHGRLFYWIGCTWLQWSVPWSLSICVSVSGSRATTVCVAFFFFFCCNTGLLFSFQRNHGVS